MVVLLALFVLLALLALLAWLALLVLLALLALLALAGTAKAIAEIKSCGFGPRSIIGRYKQPILSRRGDASLSIPNICPEVACNL